MTINRLFSVTNCCKLMRWYNYNCTIIHFFHRSFPGGNNLLIIIIICDVINGMVTRTCLNTAVLTHTTIFAAFCSICVFLSRHGSSSHKPISFFNDFILFLIGIGSKILAAVSRSDATTVTTIHTVAVVYFLMSLNSPVC